MNISKTISMDIKLAQKISDLALKQRSDFSSVCEFMFKYYLKNEGEGTAEILQCPKCNAKYSSELNKCPNCASLEIEKEIDNKNKIILNAEQEENKKFFLQQKNKLENEIKIYKNTINRLKGENRLTEANDLEQQLEVLKDNLKEINLKLEGLDNG